jgi:hypothetical protein
MVMLVLGLFRNINAKRMSKGAQFSYFMHAPGFSIRGWTTLLKRAFSSNVSPDLTGGDWRCRQDKQ